MRQFLTVLAVVVLGLQAVLAQSAASSFDELSTKVKRGETLHVLDTSVREMTGTFVEVSPASIVLMVEGQRREILLTEVREVARRDGLRNGMLIGAGFGAGVGVLSGLACGGFGYECTSGDRVAVVLAGAAVYGAIGAGIDKLIHGREVVYRAIPQRTVRLIPVFSEHQVSARLSFGF